MKFTWRKTGPWWQNKKSISFVVLPLAVAATYNACTPSFQTIEPNESVDLSSVASGLPTGAPVNEMKSGPPNLSVVSRCDSSQRGLAQEAVVRLTRVELLRLLQTRFPSLFEYYWFPDSFYKPYSDPMAAYPAEIAEDPNENFNPLHNEAQIEAWMDIADSYGTQVAGNATERSRYGGACINGPTPDEACWRNFIANLGEGLFRRPVDTAEVDRLYALVPQGDVNEAVKTLVSYLLRSPNTIFHITNGTPDGTGRYRLNDFEVAERLAFRLTSAPPDADLMNAAKAGKLKTVEQVRAQALRLMDTNLAKSRFNRFLDEWMRVSRIPRPPESQSLDWDYNTLYLDRSYKNEIGEYFGYIVWNIKGNFQDLMTKPIAFPTDNKLADVYKTAITKSGVPVDTPDHPGLVLRAGFLASGTDQSSPILRGVMFKRRVMCDLLPSPNGSVVQDRLLELKALDPAKMSNVEMVTHVTSPAACIGCHSQINPIGFALEAYNAIGIKKDVQEYIIGWNPRKFANFPLPGPQTVNLGGQTINVSSPKDLTDAVGQSQQARTCLSVRLFRSMQQRPETDSDGCAIAESVEQMKQGKPLFEVLAQSVANEDIFWRRSP